MICTTKRKGASWLAYCTAKQIMTTASDNAEWTGFLAKTITRAASTMMGANSQKDHWDGVTIGTRPASR